MDNTLLITLLAIAAILLAVSGELAAQTDRLARLAAGILGIVVLVACLVR